MSECIKFSILCLLAISLAINQVDSKKTGAQLSASKGIPLKMILKNEPTRQDSNGEISRAIHLCMEEEDHTERLITCDRRYASKFACVGSWEGVLKNCDKFGEDILAAPICVEGNLSYAVICEYKTFKSSGLCSPKKPWKNYNREFGKNVNYSEGFRENIRACKKTNKRMKRLCFKNGILIHCDEKLQGLLTSNNSSVISDKWRNTSDMMYKKVNTLFVHSDNPTFEIPTESSYTLNQTRKKKDFSSNKKSQFQSTLLNKPYRTSVVTNKSESKQTFKYNRINNEPTQRSIFGNSKHYSNLSEIMSLTANLSPFNRESDTEVKEISSSQTKFSVNKAKYPLREIDVFEKTDELTTTKLNEQLKSHVLSTRKIHHSRKESEIDQQQSRHGESPTNNPQWDLKISQMTPKITKRSGDSEKRIMEAEYDLENSGTFKMSKLSYRAPRKPNSQTSSRRIPSNTKEQVMYFHVLHCKDCDIKHDMIVDKDAEDVLPEVEIWTFKP